MRKVTISYLHVKINDKDILRLVFKFSKTQPRPVAKNATPRPSVRIELTRPRESSATLCQVSHEGRCWERVKSYLHVRWRYVATTALVKISQVVIRVVAWTMIEQHRYHVWATLLDQQYCSALFQQHCWAMMEQLLALFSRQQRNEIWSDVLPERKNIYYWYSSQSLCKVIFTVRGEDIYFFILFFICYYVDQKKMAEATSHR